MSATKIACWPSHEEETLSTALMNAYSFVIKGDELIIYFTGAEDKNVLIFQKNDKP